MPGKLRRLQISALALALTLLAGCGGAGNPTQGSAELTPAEATQASDVQTGTETDKPAEPAGFRYDMTQEERTAILTENTAKLDFDCFVDLYPKDLFPVTKEKASIKMGVVRGAINGPMTEMSLFRKLSALTNVEIECVEIAASSKQETLNLMLASGEKLPDCFWGVNMFTDNDIVTYGASGTFLDFTPYLDVMPNLKSVMAKCESEFQVCKIDGKLYTLPYIEQQEGNTSVFSILYLNNNWLKNLGLEVPKTTDEYANVLKAFRDQDANGNGNAKDEIPLTSHKPVDRNNMQKSFLYLFGAFGSRDNKDHFEVSGGKVLSTANTEGYKNAIKWMNSLQKEGLIDPEAFTQDESAFNARANQDGGVYGSFLCWRASAFMSAENADTYIAVPPLAGPDGTRAWSRENSIECIKNAFVMTKDATDPELVARFVDTCFNEYISVETNWGPFGIIQNKDDKGQWAADYTIVPENYNFSEWRDYNRAKGPAACLSEYYETFCAWDPNALYRTDVLKEMYFPVYPNEFYPPLYFTVEDSTRLNTIETQYRDYVNEMQAKWITSGGIDEGWEEYLKNLESIGLSEALSIRQKYYDAHMGQ